ncbi:hypothetical protein YC2023_074337 [Brassica napus]
MFGFGYPISPNSIPVRIFCYFGSDFSDRIRVWLQISAALILTSSLSKCARLLLPALQVRSKVRPRYSDFIVPYCQAVVVHARFLPSSSQASAVVSFVVTGSRPLYLPWPCSSSP